MKNDAKMLIKGELIGLTAEVIESTNKSDVGISGKIVDETKNTLTIDGKKVFKKNVKLRIGKYEIDGKKIIARSHERIKL